MRKSDLASILLLLGVLAFAVIIVDERWLRVAVAFLPTLLLVQLAMEAGGGMAKRRDGVGGAERRMDDDTRAAVDELLKHIREFYLTCHLMGTGRMTADQAVEKTAQKEKELNRLLGRVTELARVRKEAEG